METEGEVQASATISGAKELQAHESDSIRLKHSHCTQCLPN